MAARFEPTGQGLTGIFIWTSNDHSGRGGEVVHDHADVLKL
jgi:hypothetical protein